MAPSNLLKGSINKISGSVDWILFSATLLLVSAGLVTMNSFVEPNPFFEKQIIWVIIGIALFFTLSFIDFRFLRRSGVIVSLFAKTGLI